jgi:COMPASS component SWD3
MICVWKMPFEATPTPIFQVQRPTGIKSVAISPDAHWVVAPGVGRGIIVWDIAAGKQLGDLTGHCGISRSIEFTADGAGLLCISEDMLANTDEVRSMAISADGFWIVSCSSDGGICFWEKSSTKPHFILYGHQSKSGVFCVLYPACSMPVDLSHSQLH